MKSDMLRRNDITTFIRDYKEGLFTALDVLDEGAFYTALKLLINTYNKKGRVFVLGNGGSASTAEHMSCDLIKSTREGAKKLRVICLNDNAAVLTAYANDLSFESIFLEQLKDNVEKNDLLIIISGSGNSKNLIRAIEYANEKKIKSIGFLGFTTGGKLASLVACPIIVKSNEYGPIEDAHLMLSHMMSLLFKQSQKKEK